MNADAPWRDAPARSWRFLRSPSGLLVAGRVVQFMGQVLPVLLLPALLSRAEFVDFSLVVPLGVLAGSIVCGWLTAALARHAFSFLAEDSRELRTAVTAFFVLLGGLCLVLYVLLNALTDSLFAVVPLLVFAGSLRTTILVTLNSAHRPQPFFAASVLYLVPTIVFLVACATGVPSGLEHSLLLLVAGETVAGLIITVAGGQEFLPARRTGWRPLRGYFAFGAPLIPGAIALWVLSISDRYLLAAWTDDIQTANYVLSYQLGGAIINYPMMLFLSVFEPRILLTEQQRGTGAAQSFINNGARRFAWWAPVLFVLACILVLVGKRLAYPGFEAQVAVTALIIGAHLIQAAGHFPRKSLELTGRTRRIAGALGLAAVSNVAANVVLIPWAGATGAAAATVLAYVVYIVVLRRAPDGAPTRPTTA